MKSINKYGCLAVVIVFCCASIGIVLHEGYAPSNDWGQKPQANICGRWGANASCVVISADCVITTNHQGGDVGTSVVISGNNYKVARVERFENSDIRVAKLALADFDDYIELYEGETEVLRDFVISGYGKSRAEKLKTPFGTVYGYKWGGTTNETLRWGSNIIDSVSTEQPLLIADFDPPGAAATNYEATLAQWDSGGGWFVNVSDSWQLVGICYSVTTHPDNPSQSRFRDPLTGLPAPDKLFAHRISFYSNWINQTAQKLAKCGNYPEDISEDCRIDTVDIKQLCNWWCNRQDPNNLAGNRCDINSDGDVNLLDFARIAKQWDTNYW